jgi:hypothetical protein
MNAKTFYFWDNGKIYRFDKPTLVVPKPIPPKVVFENGESVEYNVHELKLLAVAMSYEDEDTGQTVFVARIPHYPAWPEIRLSKDFPADFSFENRLIAAIVDIVHPT